MSTPTVRMTAWAAATTLAAAIRNRYAGSIPARRWRRDPRNCPRWCAADHRCTARHGYPGGEHRSAPITWQTGYGTMTAVYLQRITGPRRLELNTSIRLDADAAPEQARMLPPALDLVIRAILAPDTASALGTPPLGEVEGRR